MVILFDLTLVLLLRKVHAIILNIKNSKIERNLCKLVIRKSVRIFPFK